MIICMLLFLITNNQNHCYNVHIDQVKLPSVGVLLPVNAG